MHWRALTAEADYVRNRQPLLLDVFAGILQAAAAADTGLTLDAY